MFWDVSLFRGVHAQELKALADSMDTVYGASLKEFDKDKICWKLELRRLVWLSL